MFGVVVKSDSHVLANQTASLVGQSVTQAQALNLALSNTINNAMISFTVVVTSVDAVTDANIDVTLTYTPTNQTAILISSTLIPSVAADTPVTITQSFSTCSTIYSPTNGADSSIDVGNKVGQWQVHVSIEQDQATINVNASIASVAGVLSIMDDWYLTSAWAGVTYYDIMLPGVNLEYDVVVSIAGDVTNPDESGQLAWLQGIAARSPQCPQFSASMQPLPSATDQTYINVTAIGNKNNGDFTISQLPSGSWHLALQVSSAYAARQGPVQVSYLAMRHTAPPKEFWTTGHILAISALIVAIAIVMIVFVSVGVAIYLKRKRMQYATI
jgi:hypothetical protein